MSRAHRRGSVSAIALFVLAGFPAISGAAPLDRVTRPVDTRQTRIVSGSRHRLAQPEFDQGPVDPGMHMDHILLMVKPSPAQQAELDQLLVDQQNPSSPLYRKWLTPEEFGNRFGLSPGDHSKVVAWLASEGLTVDEAARGRNWVAFSGTAEKVSKSLRTPLRRFEVDGVTHYANSSEASVPEALSGVAGGFLGLDDFYLRSMAIPVPEYNSGTLHYLVPEDYATIYNIAPLYQAGFDGTGQNIAIVGQSNVLLSDIRAFRTRYNLPVNDPKIILYSTSDPGFNGAQLEGNLDLEWAGAIAPKANLTYVYGPNAFTATVFAVNMNVAPIISISYGGCEVNYAASYYRSIAQQANAQGITILAASGDSGAGGCDAQGSQPFATKGRMVDFPAVMPEVTAVGGTQFVEGTGNYWATTNSPNFGSALSYIPEAAWSENSPAGLGSTGGGASQFYARPSWQNGPGVPNDQARHVPDISLSAAGHDAYYINYLGGNGGVAGTSASAPSLAGIIALLNQYQVAKGFQAQPGLGNINPQLYRLAQSAPSAFHDVTAGDNIVPCRQGSPDCLTGSFGYQTGPGYDMATGLGSIDANNFVAQWNTKTKSVTANLVVNTTRGTLNDTINATLLIASAAGGGTPTGRVDFSLNSTVAGGTAIALGSVPLVQRDAFQAADITFPLYRLGTGTFTLAATYSGDASFSSGGATRSVTVTLPTGAAGIVLSGPYNVWPSFPDAQGLTWQGTFSLREAAGVPAILTGFTIDGEDQPISKYFPSPNIPASTTVTTTVIFHNLAAPLTRTFGFTGQDSSGNTWSRQMSVYFASLPPEGVINVTATPLVVTQDTAADPSCQWAVQLSIDEMGGYAASVSSLFAGAANLSSQIPAIFGTERLDAWSSLQGKLCFGGITPPASNSIFVGLNDGLTQSVTVSFAGPPASPAKITPAPASVRLASPNALQAATATLNVGISDKTQPWTVSVLPTNRTTAWLSVAPLSGTGPGTITLTAIGAGFEPGAYRAIVVIQSPNAIPQYVNVPVMFVLGGSTSGTAIDSVVNSASTGTTGSPGMLMTIYGAKLANTTARPGTSYSSGGVSVTVNNLAAELVYISPTQINIEVPYQAGAGPAVLGVNNNGEIAGVMLQIAPAAPAIFTDANGGPVPLATAERGKIASLFLSGAGEVSPAIPTGFVPSSTAVGGFKPVLPVSVTVGGVPVFVQLAALVPLQHSLMQVDFIVPASVPPGPQPIVVTAGGVASPAATITVQ
jgi:uncharacterized protein (TIGR03437 family)